VPLYEYQCMPNGHRFEARHGYHDDPVQTCPECGAPVRRVIQPVGIVFKGSGFYATDSRKSNPASKPAAKSTESTSDGSTKSDSSSSSGADSGAAAKTDTGSTSSSKPAETPKAS
jgi:putative FmdB family regulatory protein